MSRRHIYLALAFAGLACGKPNTGVDPIEPTKPSRSGLDADEAKKDFDTEKVSGSIDPADILTDKASLVKAKYGITLRAANVDACLGEVVIRVKAKADIASTSGDKSAGLFSIEEGIVKCPGIGIFNLKEMLGAFEDQSPPPDMSKAVDVSENVIGLRALRSGLYEPARPMMPSFLATKPDSLKTINVTRALTLTDAKTDAKTSGTVAVRTIALSEYKPPKMQRTFPKVLHFETKNTGFQDVDKVAHFLFESMEFHISLAPLAILRIKFAGRASDYSGQLDKVNPDSTAAGSTPPGVMGGGSANSGFGGVIDALGRFIRVEVELDLMQQQNLDDTNTAPQNDGPVIGLRE